jgi:hypothetical protein
MTTYFWSGSNHAGEIDGIAAAGRHVGVAVHELDQAGHARAALLRLCDRACVRVIANVQRNAS